MNKKIFLILVLLFSVMTIGCKDTKTIKIGMVGTLSGANSEIGTAMKDGFLLRVDEVNLSGGINGRKIEVLIKDDNNDSEMIKNYSLELIDEGVKILFGYELSSKMGSMIEAIKDKEVIVMSPTLSSYELSGIDDNFFRTINTNYNQGVSLSDYAKHKSSKTLVIYSGGNRIFAKGVYEGYEDNFDGDVGYFSVDEFIADVSDEIVDTYISGNYDSVLYILNPHDVIYISQIFFKNNLDIDIYSSNLGMDINTLSEAGMAIEGAIFVSLIGNPDSKAYEKYRENYMIRYKKEPEFASVYAYEAACLLIDAMELSSKLEYNEIKTNLLNLGEQDGLLTDFELDEFGDVSRKIFLMIVKNGELVNIEQGN